MTALTTRDLLLYVARAIGPLRSDAMFVGGAVTWLYVTETGAEEPRPTRDVDIVVAAVTSQEYYQLTPRLRDAGFSEDQGESTFIGRWRIGDVYLDVMPTTGGFIGVSTQWFPESFSRRVERRLDDLSIWIATPPDFLAMKIAAFNDGYRGDYLESKDIEDVISVLDGRPEIVEEVVSCEETVRAYLLRNLAAMAADANFQNAVHGNCEPGRPRIVFERIQAIVRSQKGVKAP